MCCIVNNEEDITNIVYIGSKDVQSYVFAVTTQAKTNNLIRIKARGRSISKAVDVSQITLNNVLNGWILGDISIGTEKRPVDETNIEKPNQKISFIEIQLKKGEK